MRKENPDEDPRYLALIQLLRTADEIWKASRLFFERWHLSPSQFNLLNLLRLYPEGLSQTELSRYLLMHRSNITGLVDQMEKQGLARRDDVAEDRRAYRVVLTPVGARLVAEILPGYFQGAMSVWGRLPNRRVSDIAAVLEQVAGNVEAIAAEAAARNGQRGAAGRRRGASREDRPARRKRLSNESPRGTRSRGGRGGAGGRSPGRG
jgi:DNA-binding MarR family transcriptional regulator